jgi:hypothetical protein
VVCASHYDSAVEVRKKIAHFISYIIDYMSFYFSKASACNRAMMGGALPTMAVKDRFCVMPIT